VSPSKKKSLVQRIKAALGEDPDGQLFKDFQRCCGRYRKGLIDDDTYYASVSSMYVYVTISCYFLVLLSRVTFSRCLLVATYCAPVFPFVLFISRSRRLAPYLRVSRPLFRFFTVDFEAFWDELLGMLDDPKQVRRRIHRR